MEAKLVNDIQNIDPDDWNRFVSPNDPFMRHNFLATLESSGSACAQNGWNPLHVLLYDKFRYSLHLTPKLTLVTQARNLTS